MCELEAGPLTAKAAEFVRPAEGLENPDLAVAGVEEALQ
jgi:hypothetical protein